MKTSMNEYREALYSIAKYLPQLGVVLFLHRTNDLPAVFQLVRLLDRGHEERLHTLPVCDILLTYVTIRNQNP